MSHKLLGNIGTPEIVHAVSSPAEYLERARVALVQQGRQPELRRSTVPTVAYVSAGRWVVDCPCGNGPSAHPEWRLAVCFYCGAVHEPTFPADWKHGEEVLLGRPSPEHRHWFPHAELATVRVGKDRAETVDDLERENVERGHPKRRKRGHGAGFGHLGDPV